MNTQQNETASERSLECLGYARTETALADGPSEGRSAVATRLTPYYHDSRVTIYHGDNREIMPHLGQFAAVITSPPYNMRTRVNNGRYTTREKTKHFSKKYESYHDAMSVDEYYDFQNEVLTLALQRAPMAFWNVQIVTGCKEAWFGLMGAWRTKLKDVIIWDKGDGQPAMHGSVVNRGHELIMCFEAKGSAGRAFETSYFERGTMSDIWRLGRGGSGEVEGNTAIFPLDLPLKIMTGWTRPGDAILDPHGGSGTTARAAKDIGRKCTMIELDEKLCEIAAKRMSQECFEFQDTVAGPSEGRAGMQDQAAPRHNQY